MRVLLLNPKAGQAWRRLRHARAIRLHGSSLRIIETCPGEIAEQTKALVSEGPAAIYAAGGDGTVADVAAGLAGSDVPLGIVPLGTTNVLAREFRMPLDPSRALQLLGTLTTRRSLRTWVSDRGVLVLGVGVGWDGCLMHCVSGANKRWLGFGGLWLTAFRLLLNYEFPTLRVSGMDEQGQFASETATSVIVSNIRYWASANAAIPRADPGDSLLDVVLLQDASRVQLAAFWLRLMSPVGRPLALRRVKYLRLATVDISLQQGRPAKLHLNGEARGCVPISLKPGSEVQVLAPVV